MYYTYIETPAGKLLIAGDKDGIYNIRFPKDKINAPEPEWEKNPQGLRDAVQQIKDYFSGKLKNFSLKLNLQGTPFQIKVLQELQKVPYGETISYGGLARKIGNPKACRAVGAVNAKNPIPIIIPCHRVIGSNGKLVGFGGGLELKKMLLDLEQRYS